MIKLTTNKSKQKVNTSSELYEFIRQEDYIEYSLLNKALNVKKITLKKQLAKLVKLGYLEKIKRDFYVPKDSKISEYKLGNILFKGYIGLESALYLHKLIDILPFTIFVMNSKSSKEYKFRNYALKGFCTKMTYGTMFINDCLVSTKAKTIYDCLKYNHSDLEILSNAILELNTNDLNEFFSYLKQDKSNSFKQKIGFVLSKFKTENVQIKKLIAYCKKFAINKIYLDKNGKYNKDWKVICHDK